MQTYKGQRFRRIYGIILMAVTLIVGMLMIVQVWRLFLSADKAAYTTASIAAYFAPISPFVYTWLLMVIGNIVFAFVFPEPQAKVKGGVDELTALERLKRRLPDNGETAPKMRAGTVGRRWILAAVIALTVMVGGVCAYYLISTEYSARFQSEFFTAHGGVADRLVKILPWLISMFFLLVSATLFDSCIVGAQTNILKDAVAKEAKKQKELKAEGKTEAQIRREEKAEIAAKIIAECEDRGESEKAEALINKAIADKNKENVAYAMACKATAEQRAREKEREEMKAKYTKDRKVGLWIVRGVLLAAGIALIVVGIVNGGMADVFEKARNICTQCIGLG
jgi:hypothetical protein